MVQNCQEPIFTDILNFCFSVQLPHSLSFKFLFSRSLIIETRQDIHFRWILIHGVVNLCASTSVYSEPSWFNNSLKSSSSASTRDKLRSPNSTSRALSATCVAAISNKANSPFAVRRWVYSWVWTVRKSPITPWRWPRTAEMRFVLIINVDNSSSLNCSVVLTSWLVLRPLTFGRSNLPSEICWSRTCICTG